LIEQRISQPLNFIQVIVGPRQVGKTTGIEGIYQRWNGPKVLATADLPVPPSSEWIERYWQNARSLDGEVLLVFDEIQKVPRWSETVKALFDRDRKERRLRVVLLGSASLQLSTGLNDSLAGRFELIEVPHWSYNECQVVFGWSFEDYLMFGGYPGAAELISDASRWQRYVRDSIIEPALSRDIFGLVQIRNPALFRQTFELACNYPAQEISYQKLVGQLQYKGNLVTVKHYLEVLEGAFLIRLLQKFSGSALKTKSSSPKILPLCPAITHAFRDPKGALSDPVWRGRVVEMVVGAELARRYRNLFYWREGNYEVDYVVRDERGRVFAVEVKSSRPRKLSGLNQFIRKFPDSRTIVIGLDSISRFFESEDLSALIESGEVNR
jgi:predicted AAA+ superfamily ATPase